MRLAIIVLTTAGACSYNPLPTATDVDASLGVEPPPDSAVDPMPGDANNPPPETCKTSDGALTLCLELDGSGAIAKDTSGHGHDATVSGATATTRDVPAASPALSIGASTSIMIPDSSDFDQQTLTLTAWVKRTGMPASNQRFGIVDVGRKQAAMAIDDQGRIACLVSTTAGDTWVGSGAVIPANQWTMVACTYDSPELCMYTFPNGTHPGTVDCGNTDGASIDTSINAGGTIGAMFDSSNQPIQRLTGSIDSVRIYSRALTTTQLCAAGGMTGC